MQEQTLVECLHAHGYKLTQARRAVIHALAISSTPLSVNDLYARATPTPPTWAWSRCIARWNCWWTWAWCVRCTW